MGRQIEHLLSQADEQLLIQHLRGAFPIAVVDSIYPPSWDRHTLTKTPDAFEWVILDERTIPILTKSAVRLADKHPQQPGGWGIWSRAFSCVDWDRRLAAMRRRYGRLYLNTTPDPIWAKISAATGDDIERMYSRACRWIRANCVNCETSRRPLWVSAELVVEYRDSQQKLSVSRSTQPRDPRDERFYQLRRKPKKKLTADDRKMLIRYCDAMVAYVQAQPEVAASWREYRDELLGLP